MDLANLDFDTLMMMGEETDESDPEVDSDEEKVPGEVEEGEEDLPDDDAMM